MTTSTRTYLQQNSLAELRPARRPDTALELALAEDPAPEFARFLYTAVGSDWWWTTRLDWDWQRWAAHLGRPEVETWVGWVRGVPAGYAELVGDNGDVEITCFGLLPHYLGRGLGGGLLTESLRRAWSLATRCPGFGAVQRVWLHTSTLDGPTALGNYQARGLRPYRSEPDLSPAGPAPQPWPGANRPSAR